MADELTRNEEMAEAAGAIAEQEQPDASTKSPEIHAESGNETLSKGDPVGETTDEETSKEKELEEVAFNEMETKRAEFEGEHSEEQALAAEFSEPENNFPKDRGEKSYEELYTYILDRFKSFSPAEEVAGKITEEHIAEYLESSREDRMHEYRERLTKRLLTAFELAAVLTAVILIVYFLKDNPAILVNILYIIGALLALWIWKHPHKKDD